MTKWDKILIVFIIFISLLSIGILTYYQSRMDVLYGVIELNGEEYDTINLSEVDEPYTIKVENGDEYNIIHIDHNSMKFIEATCPDKDCIKIGNLDAPGKISVCLPNSITIRVYSLNDKDDGLDSTTY